MHNLKKRFQRSCFDSAIDDTIQRWRMVLRVLEALKKGVLAPDLGLA